MGYVSFYWATFRVVVPEKSKTMTHHVIDDLVEADNRSLLEVHCFVENILA